MTAYDHNNIFARILKKEIPCKFVKESAHSFAFHDIAPAAPLHILVIPKGSYKNLHDFTAHAPAEEILDFWQLINQIVSEMGMHDKGFRLITNMGDDGGQEVPHFHAHLLGGAPLRPLTPQIIK